MTTEKTDYFSISRRVLADTGIQSLSDIAILQDERVRQRAEDVALVVRRWADDYPSILQNRIKSLSLTCSVMCIDFELEVAIIAVKVAVLLFAIDDIVDGTTVSPRDDEADALLVLCRDIALAGGNVHVEMRMSRLLPPVSQELAVPWRTAAMAFNAYCRDLHVRSGSALYYQFFARMFAQAMEGMQAELRARRAFIEASIVPDFDGYLDAGKRSIASPVVYAAVLAMLVPPLTPDEVRRSEGDMEEFALMGGACLRLANDVRSYTRELEHEQRPNSVIILARSLNLTEREAEAEVVKRADRCLAELSALAARLPDSLAPWAKSVEVFTTLMRNWYMLRELHGS